jgi:hypothetical protein
MIKYFIIFEGIKLPYKLYGFKLFEKINLNKNIILEYF